MRVCAWLGGGKPPRDVRHTSMARVVGKGRSSEGDGSLGSSVSGSICMCSGFDGGGEWSWFMLMSCVCWVAAGTHVKLPLHGTRAEVEVQASLKALLDERLVEWHMAHGGEPLRNKVKWPVLGLRLLPGTARVQPKHALRRRRGVCVCV